MNHFAIGSGSKNWPLPPCFAVDVLVQREMETLIGGLGSLGC